MTTQELTELGLQPKEATLYQTCIELGPSKALDIARHTSLNRGTIYDVARSLILKGLLSTTQKKGVIYFVAHPPHKYIYKLNQELEIANELLPQIEQLLSSQHYRPLLRFFEGTEGIKQVYEETLNCKSKELVCFVSMKEIIEEVGADFIDYFAKKRIRRHIHIRMLKDPTGEINESNMEYPTNTDVAQLRESRLGPKSIDIAGNCMIFDDTVALMSTKRENFGVLLHSHEFAVMFRNLFESIWEISKPA